MNDVNFVAENDDWNAKLYLEDTFTEFHFQTNVLSLITIGVEVITVATRLKFFFTLDDQFSIVVQLRFLVSLNVPLNFLFHFFVGANRHFGKHVEQTFAQS